MNKYRNVKVEEDGYKFDSKAEKKRYGELKLLQNDFQIAHLSVHPKFPLYMLNKQTGFPVQVATYIADFEYRDENDNTVIEDVKGVRTAVYRLKAKMFKAQYGITITEIEA